MKKHDIPSEYFLGAILRGFDRAKVEGKPVTCSAIWDYVVMECLRRHDGFRTMFAWDTSTAQYKNRIGTIAECIERGYVPGLRFSSEGGRRYVIEEGISDYA
jgi:hypothetical protein